MKKRLVAVIAAASLSAAAVGGQIGIGVGSPFPGTEFARTNVLAWTSAADAWGILGGSVTGHLLWALDNTYDIGASGATRPRNIYSGGQISAGSDVAVLNGNVRCDGFFYGSAPGQCRLYLNAAGNALLTDSTAASFGRLQFGGTSSSYPALKRNGATLEARLADDSGLAKFTAATFGGQSTLLAGAGNPGISTAARYFSFYDSDGTEARVATPIWPYQTLLTNLSLHVYGLGTSTNLTVTVVTNGVASSIVCSVAGNNSTVTGGDTSHGVMVPAGCTVSLKILGDNPTTSTTSVHTTWSLEAIKQ